MAKDYIYQVARIRARELSLLNSSFINQLISAKNYEECLGLLKDKGWNTEDKDFLLQEENKTWALAFELIEDRSELSALLLRNDFHNIKAAMKESLLKVPYDGIYCTSGTISLDLIKKSVSENNFNDMPVYLKDSLASIYDTFLHTGDGQLCDIMLDRLALESIYEVCKKSRNEFIREYGELLVAGANIKIALRSSKQKKELSFIKKALVECESLNIDRLARATVEGIESITTYLSSTNYRELTDIINNGFDKVELYLDNLLIMLIRTQLRESFGVGPIIAYVLARENEIKTVRIILSGKLNELSEKSVRERIRLMYV